MAWRRNRSTREAPGASEDAPPVAADSEIAAGTAADAPEPQAASSAQATPEASRAASAASPASGDSEASAQETAAFDWAAVEASGVESAAEASVHAKLAATAADRAAAAAADMEWAASEAAAVRAAAAAADMEVAAAEAAAEAAKAAQAGAEVITAEFVAAEHSDAGHKAAARALVPLPPEAQPSGEQEHYDPRRSDVDTWGRSEKTRTLSRRLTGFYYRTWFRVEWEGLEKIPTSGGALLVANHAGAIPADAPMIMHGIEEELHRPVYGLADYFFRSIPFVGTMWSRSGGVPAHPDNAHRLLRDQGQLALVFPEGTKATGKLYRERYQLRRFGRGGFVETAMRAGVPVIPIAVVGGEEAMPILARGPAGLAKAIGVPYIPLTFNQLIMGPIGTFVWLPAKMRFRVLDPVRFDVKPNQERYARSRIVEEAEAIRLKLQENLFDMLRDRHSVWFG